MAHLFFIFQVVSEDSRDNYSYSGIFRSSNFHKELKRKMIQKRKFFWKLLFKIDSEEVYWKIFQNIIHQNSFWKDQNSLSFWFFLGSIRFPEEMKSFGFQKKTFTVINRQRAQTQITHYSSNYQWECQMLFPILEFQLIFQYALQISSDWNKNLKTRSNFQKRRNLVFIWWIFLSLYRRIKISNPPWNVNKIGLSNWVWHNQAQLILSIKIFFSFQSQEININLSLFQIWISLFSFLSYSSSIVTYDPSHRSSLPSQ